MAKIITFKYSPQLVIALEPEAASLCCRRLDIASYDSLPGTIHLPVGTKYLVLDCGGGTIDITAHVICGENKVKELAAASGGPWGATEVDKNFITFMGSLLGVYFMNTFKVDCPSEWLTFMTTFEKLKKAFSPDGKSKIALPLLWSMSNLYSKMNGGKSIQITIKEASKKGVAFKSGSIVIQHETALEFFKPVIEDIVNHLELLLGERMLQGLGYMFMVGGFSESEVLQEAVKEVAKRHFVQVLVPNSAQLAVVKGAVLFGHNVTEIYSRRTKHTYGYEGFDDFDEEVHQVKNKIVHSGQEKCSSIFFVIAEKDEEIEIGDEKEFNIPGGYIHTEGKVFGAKLYRMDAKPDKPVQYTNDERVKLVGIIPLDTVCRKPAVGQHTAPLSMRIKFGGTEMEVTIKDESTGKMVTQSVDFLVE